MQVAARTVAQSRPCPESGSQMPHPSHYRHSRSRACGKPCAHPQRLHTRVMAALQFGGTQSSLTVSVTIALRGSMGSLRYVVTEPTDIFKPLTASITATGPLGEELITVWRGDLAAFPDRYGHMSRESIGGTLGLALAALRSPGDTPASPLKVAYQSSTPINPSSTFPRCAAGTAPPLMKALVRLKCHSGILEF